MNQKLQNFFSLRSCILAFSVMLAMELVGCTGKMIPENAAVAVVTVTVDPYLCLPNYPSPNDVDNLTLGTEEDIVLLGFVDNLVFKLAKKHSGVILLRDQVVGNAVYRQLPEEREGRSISVWPYKKVKLSDAVYRPLLMKGLAVNYLTTLNFRFEKEFDVEGLPLVGEDRELISLTLRIRVHDAAGHAAEKQFTGRSKPFAPLSGVIMKPERLAWVGQSESLRKAFQEALDNLENIVEREFVPTQK